jgi:hypothetical protein
VRKYRELLCALEKSAENAWEAYREARARSKSERVLYVVAGSLSDALEQLHEEFPEANTNEDP